jgi:Amt family ammonium transporter
VTFQPSLALQDTALTVCVLSILLVPFACAGLLLINTGLGRSRSAAQMALSSLCVFSVAAIAYVICGFSWQGFEGLPAHTFTVAGKSWNWIAAQPFFLRGVQLNGSAPSLAIWLQMFSVALAAMIPLGTGADRWRLGASCASAALLAGCTYPLFAHWVWGGGWLAQLGSKFGLGRGFLDAGGSCSIQVVGGLTALSIAWIVGPRRGKYSHEGMPAAIPGHNGIYVIFGCLLALVGWTGLNFAGAILFAGAAAGQAVQVAVNTMLCAGAAGLTAGVVTHTRFGKPDASLVANGWVGGLVASSAACIFILPAAAVAIGIVAGALVTFSVEWFELRLGVDDPGGAISAHAVAGIWGGLSVGLFANFTDGVLKNRAGGNSGQFLAQLVGVATLLGFVLPLTYFLNWLLNRVYPQRVAAEGERQGLDLYELGAGAYPEFMTHSDEFTQRKI